MTDAPSLILENRHTGERLALRRVVQDGAVCLELKGSLPPHHQGPPMHIHFVEDEVLHIKSGTLSAVIDGRPLTVGPGASASIPRGAAHRWWNAGDEPLVLEGYARPVVDVDRYVQAVFEVMNAGYLRAGLRCSTWLMWLCGTGTRKPRSSCRDPFKRCCFRCSSRSARCSGDTAGTTGPGAQRTALGPPTVEDLDR